jgi:hypothetical protein
MRLHVTALIVHTFFMAYWQVCVLWVLRSDQSPKWKVIKDISRILMFSSQAGSQFIVIYLFQLFAIPVDQKKEVHKEDDEYEYEFDTMRDPNADMMYYVKKAPLVRVVRPENYDLETENALEFGDDLLAGLEDDDPFKDDEEIDQFATRMSNAWGDEECKLRMAVFISFVNNADTLRFRKKVKKNRESVVEYYAQR